MKLRWGILATGKIANHFADDLLLLKEKHVIQAVASRSAERALSFAKKYKAATYHSTYQELLEDRNVDIIYIATPHHIHEEWSIKALKAGKHVLCEKPLGVSAIQTSKIIDTAKTEGKFLMEALWSRFNPTINAVLKHILSGTIGEVKVVKSSFEFHANVDPAGRLFNPNLAGGATLDIGIYPAFLSYLLLGPPKSIHAAGKLANTGVDLNVNCMFSYPKAEASMYWGLDSQAPMNAVISGTKGSITLHGRWHESDAYTIHTEEDTRFHVPRKGKGYTHEIEACYDAISNNQLEHQLWTWDDSLHLVKILDEIRNQINLKYPFE